MLAGLNAVPGLTLSCAAGHHFDVNKRGYLTTLDGSRGIHGDPRELLEARASFLTTGHYDPIAAAVCTALPHPATGAILDAGTGTGYYLAHALRRAPQRFRQGSETAASDVGSIAPEPDALALDASAAAVAMSVRATGASGLVADTWRPLAVRDQRADAILCVFAPRNASEFARVLRPGGRLVVVTPGPRHLAELRHAGLVIGMHPEKRTSLEETLAGHFTLSNHNELDYSIDVDGPTAAMLTSMGPSGHHQNANGDWPGGSVSINVDVSSWQPRAR